MTQQDDIAQTDEVVRDVFCESKFEPSVPLRYRRLIREVVETLPQGWDDHAEWSVEASPDQHPRGYASVISDEESAGETVTSYTLTIFPAWLDRLSDLACHWVFAHELGHIALGLRFGSIVIKGKPYTRHGDFYEEAPPQNIHEDAADRIALEWGFDSALQAFLEEDSRK